VILVKTLHFFLSQVRPSRVSACTFSVWVSSLAAAAKPCCWQKTAATGAPQPCPSKSLQA
jgi:hypothetical protein